MWRKDSNSELEPQILPQQLAKIFQGSYKGSRLSRCDTVFVCSVCTLILARFLSRLVFSSPLALGWVHPKSKSSGHPSFKEYRAGVESPQTSLVPRAERLAKKWKDDSGTPVWIPMLTSWEPTPMYLVHCTRILSKAREVLSGILQILQMLQQRFPIPLPPRVL